MIEELISRVFATRNAVHLAHWAETSGFRHNVLGEFYDSLIDKVDTIVEAHRLAAEKHHGEFASHMRG
jgi:hypothetical protein